MFTGESGPSRRESTIIGLLALLRRGHVDRRQRGVAGRLRGVRRRRWCDWCARRPLRGAHRQEDRSGAGSIRDLQSGFSSDANINELWRKLLLKEQISSTDRPL